MPLAGSESVASASATVPEPVIVWPSMLIVRSGRTVPRDVAHAEAERRRERRDIERAAERDLRLSLAGEPLPLIVRLVPPPADKRASTEACWSAIDAVPCSASAGSSAVSGRLTRTPLSE